MLGRAKLSRRLTRRVRGSDRRQGEAHARPTRGVARPQRTSVGLHDHLRDRESATGRGRRDPVHGRAGPPCQAWTSVVDLHLHASGVPDGAHLHDCVGRAAADRMADQVEQDPRDLIPAAGDPREVVVDGEQQLDTSAGRLQPHGFGPFLEQRRDVRRMHEAGAVAPLAPVALHVEQRVDEPGMHQHLVDRGRPRPRFHDAVAHGFDEQAHRGHRVADVVRDLRIDLRLDSEPRPDRHGPILTPPCPGTTTIRGHATSASLTIQPSFS